MSLHPALPLFAAALAVGLVRERWRGRVALAGAIGGLAAVVALAPGDAGSALLLGQPLAWLRVDALSHVFGLILAGIGVLGTLYALHVRRAGEHAATLLYAGSALGVAFAGDWVTLLAFWEVMAVASTVVVWCGGGGKAQAAGFRYLFVHVAGGACLLSGILVHLAAGGGALGPLEPGTAAYALVLLGVAVNAAVPPLHAWLTDAYPEASVTGAVFLSALTTKTAVYVLARIFPGEPLLVGAGVVMALYGVVFAVLENDIRRLLAYHIVSQVGYMVAGVGMGTALALDGVTAHAFCHILYKALLFMGAGAVIQATGRRKLTDLGGLAPRMPLVFVLYMVGAFSISGVPLFNGFISKSMVVAAATESGRPLAELLLGLASVGTFLHTGLKLPYFTFFGASSRLDPRPIPRNMLLAMGATAALCVFLGLHPSWLYARLPFGADYHPYTLDHVVSALQLLLGTGVAFWLLRRRLGGAPTVSLDVDWLYRRPLPRVVAALVAAVRTAGGRTAALGATVAGRASFYARNPLRAARPLVGLWVDPPLSAEDFDEDRHRMTVGTSVFWIVAWLVVAALALL